MRTNKGIKFGRGLGIIFHSEIYMLLVIASMLLILAFSLKAPFYVDVIIMVALYGGISSAWNILGGFVRQFSLGHAVFFGVGGYTSVILYTKYAIPPLFGMFLGGIAAAVIGGVIGYPCFRLRGPYFVLATLSLGEIFRQLSNHFKGLTNGAYGILISFSPGLTKLMFHEKWGYALLTIIYFLFVAFVSIILKRARIGSFWTAIGQNENTAEACGVASTNYKVIALIISSFLTGLGGSIYFFYVQLIDPDSAFSVWHSVNFTLFTVIGGIGTILGPIVGSLIMTPVQTLTMSVFGNVYAGLSELIYGVILILVMLYLPRGIMGYGGEWFRKTQDMSLNEQVGASSLTIGSLEGIGKDREALINDNDEIRRPVLEIKNFGKSFGGLMALNGVDLKLFRREILGIIGPNGAGKTTLFNTISGLIRRDRGSMLLSGHEIPKNWSAHKICTQGLSRTFQIMQPFGSMSVFDNVLVGSLCRIKEMTKARENTVKVLQFTGLWSKREVTADSLVPSEQKRLEVARELSTGPKVLLLDEVMAGLTGMETNDMIELIKRISSLGISIIIIEHIMKAIMSLCDRIVVLENGIKIAEGEPKEIAVNRDVIKAYLGEEYIIARD